jgi:hypothetical protein
VKEEVCLQAFDNETLRVAEPNDFNYGMGQKRLAFLFVIDAVCIGNINSRSDAQISTEARQQVVDTLGPHLPEFVGRLATPCNCDRVRRHFFLVETGPWSPAAFTMVARACASHINFVSSTAHSIVAVL